MIEQRCEVAVFCSVLCHCVIYLIVQTTLNLECLDDMNRDVYIQLDSCFVYLKYHLQTIQYKLFGVCK